MAGAGRLMDVWIDEDHLRYLRTKQGITSKSQFLDPLMPIQQQGRPSASGHGIHLERLPIPGPSKHGVPSSSVKLTIRDLIS